MSILAYSCAKENVKIGGGSEAGVSFSIEIPGTPVTKAVIGDGETATKLYYQAFYEDGTPVDGLGVQNTTLSGKTATVKFQLLKDQTYSFVFWAQTAADGYYTIDETEGLKKITANYTDKKSNDENFDAFYAVKTMEVTGAVSEKVELKRPFAQINIGSTSTISTGNLSRDINFADAASTVTVKGIPTVFSPLAATGVFSGEDDVTFAENAAPAGNITVNGSSYKYLAVNYVFAPVGGAVYDVSATLKVEGKNVNLSVPSVPAKQNWRTNIVGNLLTSEADFNVVVDSEFGGDQTVSPLFVNGVGYQTLDKAVEAVPADGKETIIKIGQDISGNGIKTNSGQNVVIDLGGNTFNIDGEMVGSATTVTNGHQFLKGSKVTIKNGTVKSTKAYILIQNYADLTLEDVVLDASESTGDKTGTYVLSNNCGNVKIIGSTSILARSGKFAFDVCYWAPAYEEGVNVYVNTTGVIDGAIEYSCYRAGNVDDEEASKTLTSLVIENADLTKSSFKTTLSSPNIKVAGHIFADEAAAAAWVPEGYKASKFLDVWYVTKNTVAPVVSASGQDELNDILAGGEAADVKLADGTYKLPATIADGVSITGQTGTEVIDGSETATVTAKNFTVSNVVVKGSGAYNDGSSLTIEGANSTVSNCTFKNGRQWTYGRDLTISQKAGSVTTISGCDFRKSGFRGIQIYHTGDEVKIDNCLFDNTYPFNVDDGPGKVTVTDSELKGWTSYTNTVELVSFTNCKFGKSTSGYAYIAPHCKTVIKDCTFSSDFLVSPSGSATFTIEFINCKYEDGTAITSAIMETVDVNTNASWIIDGQSFNY